jgi:hypothetical protein
MAARGLADDGHPEEALEVLGDACRAQRHGQTTERARQPSPVDASEDVA